MPEQLVENDNGVPPSDDKHLHAMGTRVQDLSSEKEWREFEIERWRSALRRGLRLSSLDPEHQRALFERIQPALGWRDRFFLSRPRLAKRLHLAARAALAVALVARLRLELRRPRRRPMDARRDRGDAARAVRGRVRRDAANRRGRDARASVRSRFRGPAGALRRV